MIWILGASGYIGQAFVSEAKRRGAEYRAVARNDLDYSNFQVLLSALRKEKPDFVVNASGFTGKPNVDECENRKSETIMGNVSLPQCVAAACDVAGVKLGFVSSGCIYTGAKVQRECGTWAVEDKLNEPLVSELLEKRSPRLKGFSENDTPNFCFTQNNCSFYSGTKEVAEKIMKVFPDFYVWRLRIPFDNIDNPRNYLTKVQAYTKVYNNWNSISHRGDFAAACLDAYEKKIPGGIYNIVNPGYVSTREVVNKIAGELRPGWRPSFWENDELFYRFGAKTPRSNCILDSQKILKAGIKIRGVEEALTASLASWKRWNYETK